MIVTNHTDLSPTMRAELEAFNRITNRPARTMQALVRRGYLVINEAGHYELTDAGHRARAALANPEKATPAKVASVLERAQKLGLDVHESESTGTLRSWTISSANPIDHTQVWLYWSPGARGGRMAFTTYYGARTRSVRNRPLRYIGYTLDTMANSLRNHHAREAARAEAAAVATTDVRHGVEQVHGTFVVDLTPERDNARKDAVEGTFPAVLECGCPDQIVRDEGHQEGCTIDPTRPGWFMVGQHIYDHDSRTWFRIGVIQSSRSGRVDAVAVSVDGGYGGRLSWYGNHPDAVAPLSTLESKSIGLRDLDRRAWPRTDRAAAHSIGLALSHQGLSGWARDKPEGPGVVVNIPDGTDPTRHLILLRRYVPYLAHVELQSSAKYDRYPTILITPRED